MSCQWYTMCLDTRQNAKESTLQNDLRIAQYKQPLSDNVQLAALLTADVFVFIQGCTADKV